jgi:DNA-binding winged helix-turn-helix (wHTH) protein
MQLVTLSLNLNEVGLQITADFSELLNIERVVVEIWRESLAFVETLLRCIQEIRKRFIPNPYIRLN